MQAPKPFTYNNLRRWDRPMEYIVEYEVWRAFGPVTFMDLYRRITKEYSANVRTPNISALLTRLVQLGKINKIARGLYVHPLAPDIFS